MYTSTVRLLPPVDPAPNVANRAIGEAGAANAGILAASILAGADEALLKRLDQWRKAQTDSVAETVEDKK